MRSTTASAAISLVCAIIVILYASPLESTVQRLLPFRYTGDGRISLIDVHTGEKISVVYREENGRYLDSALWVINYTLRCHGDGKELPISLKLIEFVDNIQDHFQTNTINVVSGYRSFTYNESLRKKLRRVAHNSLHIQGMAMDIRLSNVQKTQLGAYAKNLRTGGVGIYNSSNFVHVDVGPVRHW